VAIAGHLLTARDGTVARRIWLSKDGDMSYEPQVPVRVALKYVMSFLVVVRAG